MIDYIDIKILDILKENSKLSNKEIGEKLFLTGQSVGRRIKNLENNGIIKKYTILTNENLATDLLIIVYINAFVHNTSISDFLKFIKKSDLITEAHKISGIGIYLLVLHSFDIDSLNQFLDRLLFYCDYTLNISIKKIK